MKMNDTTLLWIILVIVSIMFLGSVFTKKDTTTGTLSFSMPKLDIGKDKDKDSSADAQ